MKRLYFDYNSTAPYAEGLERYLSQFLSQQYKNPSSTHRDGQTARTILDQSRHQIKASLGALKGDKLFFTSGGTEANNTILRSAQSRNKERKTLLLTRVEHVSVMNVARTLAKIGVEVDWISVDAKGQIDWNEYKKKLTNQVFLVSVMLVNNETGFVFPIQEMARMANDCGVAFHTDAVCAVGKWNVSFRDLGVDYLSFSSHKFGGLMGVGGILCRETQELAPFILGGSQEMGKRAGTENLIGIAATSFALEKSLLNLPDELVRQHRIRERLKKGMISICDQVSFIESNQNLPQTIQAAFPGCSGQLLVTNLDLENISVSYGSACSSGASEISHVLTNIGLQTDQASSAVRFSFGRETTEEDADELLNRLQQVVQRMKV